MSAPESAPSSAAAATTAGAAEASLLDQVVSATKQTERSRAEDLIRTLTDEAIKGTITWSRNVVQTIKQAMSAIDQVMSMQLAAVLHSPDLQKLEGTWSRLHPLEM